MTTIYHNLMFFMSSMDKLKRHLPASGPEGLHELRKIAERFEEKIYSTATSQVYPACYSSYSIVPQGL